MQFKKRIWEIVEVAKTGDIPSRIFDISILSLILLNVIAVIIGSIESIQVRYGLILYYFELFSIIVFTLEYITRLWSCTIDKRFSQSFNGRLRFVKRPIALVDLFAFLPFYLPFLGLDLRFIRVFRLLRIIRIAKIGRYYSSLRLIANVIKSRKEELILTTALMALLLIVASCLMYECEHKIQPNAFPDIPSTMWWAVVTLTTVGYGDVYPITSIGKVMASIIAIWG